MHLFTEYKNLKKVLNEYHDVIIYAESKYYYIYFSYIINQLINSGIRITYITSDPKDPVLQLNGDSLRVYYLRSMIGFASSRLKGGVLLMTMTELNVYNFKRSSEIKKYIYIFHASVSTHLQYKKQSFNHYDTIFCVGNYHINEIVATEDKYRLSPKKLVRFGYPLFSELNNSASKTLDLHPNVILIAPSWFNGCIFDVCIDELLDQFTTTDYQIIIKPHPEYFKRYKRKLHRLIELTNTYKNLSIDTGSSLKDLLITANYLITDRSGIAFEFAFGLERPVIFIDTDLKIMNDEWQDVSYEPVEISLRNKMGICVLPTDIDQIHDKIKELEVMKKTFKEDISNLRASIFYDSYDNGIRYIKDQIK